MTIHRQPLGAQLPRRCTRPPRHRQRAAAGAGPSGAAWGRSATRSSATTTTTPTAGCRPAHGRSARERAALLSRLAAYGPKVLEHPDVDEVRVGLKRLLGDIDHYVQRQHDLAYDEVELEIGGSE